MVFLETADRPYPGGPSFKKRTEDQRILPVSKLNGQGSRSTEIIQLRGVTVILGQAVTRAVDITYTEQVKIRLGGNLFSWPSCEQAKGDDGDRYDFHKWLLMVQIK